jgi:diadenylate cyclase
MLYQVAKMDGAILVNADGSKITWANVQMMPDPTIHSVETGTRHRTAERISKQVDALVIAISERRQVVSLYLDGASTSFRTSRRSWPSPTRPWPP